VRALSGAVALAFHEIPFIKIKKVVVAESIKTLRFAESVEKE
jgi:intracellular septation protein A